LSVKLTPDGRAGLLVADSAGTGIPVAVTVNEPGFPAAKVVALALVMTGGAVAGLTVRVKLWVAFGLTPFAAVIVSR
jgi:hypothetical protein